MVGGEEGIHPHEVVLLWSHIGGLPVSASVALCWGLPGKGEGGEWRAIADTVAACCYIGDVRSRR